MSIMRKTKSTSAGDFETRFNEIVHKLRRVQHALSCPSLVDDILQQLEKSMAIPIDLDEEFCLPEKNSDPGFYLFYIKSRDPIRSRCSMQDFEEDWQTQPSQEFQHSPAIIKKRSKNYSDLKKWVPLYLGKGEHVNRRITNHVNMEGGRKTFALKLRARKGSLKAYCLQVRSFTFGGFSGVQIFLQNIEKSLRERVNPVVGRQ